jgi:hypothetical protein
VLKLVHIPDDCNLILGQRDGQTDIQTDNKCNLPAEFQATTVYDKKFSEYLDLQNMTYLKKGENYIMRFRIHILILILLEHLN